MQSGIESPKPSPACPGGGIVNRTGKPQATLALLAWLGCAVTGMAQEVNLKWQPSEMTKELGGYMPQRLRLSTNRPALLKKAPDDVTAPLFGELTIGPKEAPAHCLVLVDEPEGKPSRLFVDANGNGDLTDDPAPQWSDRKVPGPGGKENV